MATPRLTKEQLSDRLGTAMNSHLEAFVAQKSDDQIAKEAEIERLEKMITKEPAGSSVAPMLKMAVDKLKAELDTPGLKEPMRKEAALAVLIVCNAYRLPLQLKQDQPAAAQSAAPTRRKNRKRITREELDDACDAIMGILPPKDTADHHCMSKIRIAEKTDLDAKTVSSALARLNRQETATSNGIRGAGGGWRKL